MTRPVVSTILRRLTCQAACVVAALAFAATPGRAQTPQTFHACYVASVGAIYLIKLTGLPDACLASNHVALTWTDGASGVKSGDAAGGDLAATYPNPTVAKLQGQPISAIVPSTGQVLTWNGTAWEPAAPAGGGGASDHGALTGLTDDDHLQYLLASGARALSGALDAGSQKIVKLAAGTAAGDAVRFEQAVKAGDAAGGDLAATYPTPSVAKLQGQPVSATAPSSSGQVLTWNGTAWEPATPAASVTDHGLLAGLTDDDHTQYLLADGNRASANGFAVTGTFTSGTIPLEGEGTRLMWYPAKAAFRAGTAVGTTWDAANVGEYSTATGAGTKASGAYSTAFGFSTQATGEYSTASGYSTAASGFGSTALGGYTTASGTASTALGTYASTNGQDGAFVYGDYSTAASSGALVTASVPNQFVVRAAGGFRLRTAADLSTGCDISAAGGLECIGAFGTGTIPVQGAGTRLMWYPRQSAFRAGSVGGSQWDDANVGSYSTALGLSPTASGYGSTALGAVTTASGSFSTALGYSATASGVGSTALGYGTTASGSGTMALGTNASTNNQIGSFVYGDASTANVVTASNLNQFVVRAAGGTTFYSNSGLTTGVTLAAGGGSWASVSDRHKKQNFRDEDGERVLEQIARLPIPSWNYKSQDRSIRHLGPTAQDFRAAFGLGESDTTISTIDADGVALLAAQALERRTAELRAGLEGLKTENAALLNELQRQEKELAELRAQVARLEAALAATDSRR